LSRWLVGSSRSSTRGVGEERPAELDPPPLPAGEHAEGKVDPVRLDAEARRDLARVGFAGIAAGVTEDLLGVGEAVQGLLGVVGLQRQPRLLQPDGLAVQVAAAQEAGERSGVDRPGVGPGVLRHVAEGAAPEHHAARRLDLAGENLEEACLAGAVAPDQPDLVAVTEQEAAVLDDGAGRDFHGEIGCLEHGTGYCAQPRQ